MSRRSVLRRLLDPLLALSVVAGTQVVTPLCAQVVGSPQPPRFPGTTPSPQFAPPGVVNQMVPPLRYVRNVAGEAAPIVLAADQVATWYESEQTLVVLLRGQVYVQQGTVQVRCDQAVARFDLKAHHDRGLWPMGLYAEGQIRLDTGADAKEGDRAVVELTTRGEIKLQSVKGKAIQQAQSDDLLYRRALAERAQAPTAPLTQPGTIQPVRMPVPALPDRPVAPSAPVQPRLDGPTGSVPVSPYSLPPTSLPPTPTPLPPTPVRPMTALPAPGTFIARGAPPDESDGVEEDRHEPVLLAQGPPPDPAPPLNNVPSPPIGSPSGGPPAVIPPGATPLPVPPPSKPSARPAPAPAVVPAGRTFSVRPRFGSDFQLRNHPLGNGENAYIITGGVIVNLRGDPKVGQIDIEADRCVIFSHGQSPTGGTFHQTQPVGDNTKLEFYLAGNVEIRELDKRPNHGERVIRGDEVYLDVDRNVAVALHVQMEMRQPNVPDPLVIKADELLRTSADTYETTHTELSSSKLPSDPGLKIYTAAATIEEKTAPKVSLFHQEVVDRTTGKTILQTQDYVRARDVFFELESVPFFYLPYLAGDARDPLGPVDSISGGYNSVYGAEFDVSLNVYELLGIQPLLGTRWHLMLDYLTARGPAGGTEFDFSGKDFLGLPSQRYDGVVKAYGIYDHGIDNLGGPRPQNFEPTNFRGRFLWREGVYGLPNGFTVQTQIGAISDRNYLEAYDKSEWDTDLPQHTFAYVKQQGDYWAWTGLVDDRLGREWVTQTEWLPRVDGIFLGLSPLDGLTYNAKASAAYARLRTSNDPNFMPLSPTDVATNTGRIDVMQEVSYPFYLGPVKVVPYGELDLADYTDDLNGTNLGRVWGAVGVRSSLPFTRLFPDVQSELWNLNGINHKIVLSANYFNANTSASHLNFPQLDRLNDDATDQAVRDVREFGYGYLPPSTQHALLTSPYYDPQYVAMRNLLDSNPDSLDTMQVLQLDVNQRLQTKRGYPGAEHIIDWMTLDVSASIFPAPSRDNFGSVLGLATYDYTWNIGDRTALVSSGLVDTTSSLPETEIFTIGAFLNRPDRTNFYLGYRQIEPLESRLVTASVTYVFSPKYAMTATTAYDFGPSKIQVNSLAFTRIGTDLQLSLGVSYNSLQNSLGFIFEIVPNLAANMHRGGLGSLQGLGNAAH